MSFSLSCTNFKARVPKRRLNIRASDTWRCARTICKLPPSRGNESGEKRGESISLLREYYARGSSRVCASAKKIPARERSSSGQSRIKLLTVDSSRGWPTPTGTEPVTDGIMPAVKSVIGDNMSFPGDGINESLGISQTRSQMLRMLGSTRAIERQGMGQ